MMGAFEKSIPQGGLFKPSKQRGLEDSMAFALPSMLPASSLGQQRRRLEGGWFHGWRDEEGHEQMGPLLTLHFDFSEATLPTLLLF